MRALCLLFLFSPLLLHADFKFIASYADDVYSGATVYRGNDYRVVTYTHYNWAITEDLATGNKFFYLAASTCRSFQPDPQVVFKTPGGPSTVVFPPTETQCTPKTYANAITISEIQAALSFFYNLAPGKVAHIITYDNTPYPWVTNPKIRTSPQAMPRPELTTSAPATPADPQLIYLDELGNNTVVSLDLTTGAALSQTTLPNSALGPFGIRPNPTGAPNEVWVANSGTQIPISVVDLGAQKVAATIPGPTVPAGAIPVGIVFANDGQTAFEAVRYSSADSSGNNGALLVIDAVDRVYASMLPLKYVPTAFLMAPDGLTAYLLSANGMITYYDVLSGTADLSVSTFTPGKAGGYSGPSSVFIHPDGTKLFWNLGVQLNVFDLDTHTVTALYNSGLPTTSQATMQMSQDGATIWFASASGQVAILDARYGNVVATIQNSPGPQLVLPSPAN